MTIIRTIVQDGITVFLNIALTPDELREAYAEHQELLAKQEELHDLLFGDPMSAFMQNLLSSGICTTEEEAGAIARAYIHDKYAADFALNEEDTTDAE